MLAYRIKLSDNYMKSVLTNKKIYKKHLSKDLSKEQAKIVVSDEETKDKTILKARKELKKAVLQELGETTARDLAFAFVPEAAKMDEHDCPIEENEEYFDNRSFTDYNDDVYYSPTISKSTITFIVQPASGHFDAISLEDIVQNNALEFSSSSADEDISGEFLDY